MRDFKEAYQNAVNELPRCHLNAEELLETIKKEPQRRTGRILNFTGRAVFKGIVAASVFLLCGVGTVTAINYHNSRIQVRDNGYTITGPNTRILEEPEQDGGLEDANVPEAMIMGEMPASGQPAKEDSLTEEQADVEILEAEVFEPIRYESFADFEKEKNFAMALPELAWLESEFQWESIIVFNEGERVMISLGNEEQNFHMSQWDNRNYDSYASSTAFSGESVNERTVMNAQGLDYVVFDSMEGEEITSTHAVISINGRDLSMDFFGFEEDIINKVLMQLDLSVYFQEE